MSFITDIITGSQGAHAYGAANNLQVGARRDAIAKILNAVGITNEQLGIAGHDAAFGVLDSANQADARLADAIKNGQEGMNGAVTTANGYLSPYMQLGEGTAATLGDMLKDGGRLNKDFGMEDFQADPGYQFRMDQANKALQRSAAARGNVLGGAAISATQKLSQDLASQEYQAAYKRFSEQGNDRYNRLTGATQIGLSAANQAGGNVMNGAQFNGQLGLNGETVRANLGQTANQYAGNMGFNTALAQGNNTMNGAAFDASQTIGIGDVSAANMINQQGQKNKYIGGIVGLGEAVIAGAAGGFAGGGWSGALSGGLQGLGSGVTGGQIPMPTWNSNPIHSTGGGSGPVGPKG
jgi:hypothetical protein